PPEDEAPVLGTNGGYAGVERIEHKVALQAKHDAYERLDKRRVRNHRQTLAGMIVDYLSNHAPHTIAGHLAAFAAWEGVPGALAHDQPGDLRTLLLGKQPDIVVGLDMLDLP